MAAKAIQPIPDVFEPERKRFWPKRRNAHRTLVWAAVLITIVIAGTVLLLVAAFANHGFSLLT
ncbi:MAG: hypothetical protein O2905_07165 [Proteobacteria bacterium]|nr:hypothetical protein [Pseudomonadota bacterium]MDA1132987.1 hypothetical protein [Pseudomonadota bacterium]